jgi:hypothetical protein
MSGALPLLPPPPSVLSWSIHGQLYFFFNSFDIFIFTLVTTVFARAFSSFVRQTPGYTSQRRGTVRTLPNLWFVLFCILFFLSIVLFYVLFMCKCVLLPPGVNPVAVNKHIISVIPTWPLSSAFPTKFVYSFLISPGFGTITFCLLGIYCEPISLVVGYDLYVLPGKYFTPRVARFFFKLIRF